MRPETKRKLLKYKRYMQKHEKILLYTRQHYIESWKALCLLIILGGAGISLHFLAIDLFSTMHVNRYFQIGGFVFDRHTTPIASLLSLAGLAVFIIALIKYYGFEFILTSERVIYKFSIFDKKVGSELLRELKETAIEQSLLGRILDYGDVILTDISMAQVTLPNIPQPYRLLKEIEDQQTRLHEQGETRQPDVYYTA